MRKLYISSIVMDHFDSVFEKSSQHLFPEDMNDPRNRDYAEAFILGFCRAFFFRTWPDSELDEDIVFELRERAGIKLGLGN